MAVAWAATAVVETLKVAEVCPWVTTTDAGTEAAEAPLFRVTVWPPAGAAPLRVTVPTLGLPPATLTGFRVSDETVSAVPVPPVPVRLIVNGLVAELLPSVTVPVLAPLPSGVNRIVKLVVACGGTGLDGEAVGANRLLLPAKELIARSALPVLVTVKVLVTGVPTGAAPKSTVPPLGTLTLAVAVATETARPGTAPAAPQSNWIVYVPPTLGADEVTSAVYVPLAPAGMV